MWAYSDLANLLSFPLEYLLLIGMYLMPLSFSIFSILYSKHFYSDNNYKKYISRLLFVFNLLLLIFMIHFFISAGIGMYPAFD